MKNKSITNKVMTAVLLLATTVSLEAAVRVNVRLGAGHPLARPGRTVVVRSRPTVVVRERVMWAPPVVFAPRVVVAPGRDMLVWEDSETIQRREDWVDSSLNVNNRGKHLFLRLSNRAQIDFAEVHFNNGQAQVVDFRNNVTMEAGTYSLLDFADGRQVDYVRIVARARAPQTRITVLMGK
ncbi:MAG: hypothetical protein HY820_00890 [Acidobacteria bacterium]|nr:hypothetical protein [Acidobacteriota bacterium]